MKDCNEEELTIGDRVVVTQYKSTYGESMAKGKVIGFTDTMIKVKTDNRLGICNNPRSFKSKYVIKID